MAVNGDRAAARTEEDVDPVIVQTPAGGNALHVGLCWTKWPRFHRLAQLHLQSQFNQPPSWGSSLCWHEKKLICDEDAAPAHQAQ